MTSVGSIGISNGGDDSMYLGSISPESLSGDSGHVSIVDETPEQQLNDQKLDLDDDSSTSKKHHKLMSASMPTMGGLNRVRRAQSSERSIDSAPDPSSRRRSPFSKRKGHASFVRRSLPGNAKSLMVDSGELSDDSEELDLDDDHDDEDEDDDEDDDDFDVQAATRPPSGAFKSSKFFSSSSTASSLAERGRSLWKTRPEQESVDQSVNLMDAETGQYSRRNMNRGCRQKSLVDIFLQDSEHSNRGGPGRVSSGASVGSLTKAVFKGGDSSLDFFYDHDTRNGRFKMMLISLCVCLSLGALLLVPKFGEQTTFTNDGNGDYPNELEEMDMSAIPTTSRRDAIQFILVDQDVSDTVALEDPDSAQAKALRWIDEEDSADLLVPGLDDDKMDDNDDLVVAAQQLIQRYVLAVFYFEMQDNEVNDNDQEEGQRRQRRKLREPTEEEVDNRHVFDSQWTVEDPVCQWPGVSCNQEQEVTGLNVSYSLLEGPLPREILRGSGLPKLTSLDLSRNQLSGRLPNAKTPSPSSQLGANPASNQLQSLFLQHNFLQGELNAIYDLERLTHLDLSTNDVTGDFDDLPMRMTELETFHLAMNRLGSTLPSDMASLSKLVHLDLEGNQFTGTIPAEWAQLSNLETLTLSHCLSLTGEIPSEMKTMTNLQYLSLQRTLIGGTIPSALGRLTRLKELHLHKTELKGQMPGEICKLMDSYELDALTSDCSDPGEIVCDCCTDCY